MVCESSYCADLVVEVMHEGGLKRVHNAYKLFSVEILRGREGIQVGVVAC